VVAIGVVVGRIAIVVRAERRKRLSPPGWDTNQLGWDTKKGESRHGATMDARERQRHRNRFALAASDRLAIGDRGT
jgi:hypothetical protein